ncbi:MAG: Slp family lipoprotein [Candidatus Thiodiazotropha sp.]
MKHPMTLTTGLLLALTLSGCASQVPELIRTAPAGDVRVEEVQKQDNQFVGSEVRWGGHIISVRNQPQVTLIEVLSRRLDKEGKPLEEGQIGGRFLARIPGFLEPEEYPKDRLLTVKGEVKQVIEQQIGNYPYPYPVVEVEAYHLWPEEKRYPPSYYYDPFYDPYFYPYPYWRRYPYPYYW